MHPVVLAAVAAVGLVIWLVPPAISTISSRRCTDAVEVGTRVVLVVVAVVIVGAALDRLAVTARTYRLAEQGQITDRYTKAIEQLGGDKLGVRLGGIYALERIAHDSKRDHPTVVEVLGAFVRERTDPARTERPTVTDVLSAFLTLVDDRPERNPTSSDAGTKIKPPADVQAALTVLGRPLGRSPPSDRRPGGRLTHAPLHPGAAGARPGVVTRSARVPSPTPAPIVAVRPVQPLDWRGLTSPLPAAGSDRTSPGDG